MAAPLRGKCRQRGLCRVFVYAVVTLALLLAIMESQTRGYSHFRDILTFPYYYMQSSYPPLPGRCHVTIDTKYEGEDEMTTILTRRLSEFSSERENLRSVLCPNVKPSDMECYDSTCNGTFSPSPRERLRQILSTRLRIPQNYQQAMKSATESITPHKYIFVTAVSSNHYHEMQGLVRTVHQQVFPRLSNFTFVIFDLGLTMFERYATEKNCRCTVLDFPFSELPQYVRHLTCYSWKPIAIASLIDKAEYLVWTDASIRWNTTGNKLETLFQRARQRGFQCIKDHGSIAVRTVKSMFDFYGDQQCQYSPYGEMLSGFEMFYNDRLTRDAVIQAWLSCAFDQRCMCVRDHTYQFRCPEGLPRYYGQCHRYDQSSIGIIQSKLLLDQRPIIYVPRDSVLVAREVKLDWFTPTKTDIIVCVVTVCLVVNVLCVMVVSLGRWSNDFVPTRMDNLRLSGIVVVTVMAEVFLVRFLLCVFV